MTENDSGRREGESAKPERALFQLAGRGFRAWRAASSGPSLAGWLTNTQQAIVDLAEDLARRGRMDDEAVHEIRSLAHGREHDLRRAVANLAHHERHRESKNGSAAYRLAVAALRNSAVPVLDSVEAQRIDLIEHFAGIENDDAAFKVLVERDSRLADLEGEVRSGAIAEHVELRNSTNSEARERLEASVEHLTSMVAIKERLSRLLGPRSGQADPLLSSYAGFDRASYHLVRLLEASVPSPIPPGESGLLKGNSASLRSGKLLCPVCHEPIDFFDASTRHVMLGRARTITKVLGKPIQSRSETRVMFHERCVDEGATQAAREGLSWRVVDTNEGEAMPMGRLSLRPEMGGRESRE